MKIVDIAEFFSERGGGVRSYLGELASEGSKRGHEITVIAPGPKDVDEAFNGGRLIRFAGPAMPYDPSYHLLYRVDRIKKALRDIAPDVVQASSPYLPALVARSADAPLRSFVYHSDQIATYVRPVLEKIGSAAVTHSVMRAVNTWPRLLSRGFDLTVAPSAAIARTLEEAGCARVHCVKFGIRSDIFKPGRSNPETRKKMLGKFGDTKNAALVVVACRLAVEKRVNQIIDAIDLANRERPTALVVLGDGPERAKLEEQAKKLPQVMFPGFLPRPEYADLLASADVFVHGGAAETFGFVLGEAVISGIPLVVPDAGAAFDFVREDSEAYPAYGGPPAIAKAILASLKKPRSGPNTGAHVRTTSEHFDELFALYDRELSKKKNAA